LFLLRVTIDFKPIPKVDKMIRIASRKSWISEVRRSIPILSKDLVFSSTINDNEVHS